MLRIVHYLNQFFGQVGGEEKGGMGPMLKQGPCGPGVAFAESLADLGVIAGSVVCGDNYIAENTEQALQELLPMIRSLQPDLLIAGPAFNAGRYGPACGAVCKAVQKELRIPAITAMYPENPGVDLYRRDVLIVRAGPSAAGMRDAVRAMSALLRKRVAGEATSSEVDGYFPSGIRENIRVERSGAVRAVDMLLELLAGREITTELPMPVFDYVPPAPPVRDMAKARIALVTEGGFVPKGNPDQLESSRAGKHLRYELHSVETLSGTDFQTVHGGYNNSFVNEDPNRLVPVDALRALVREGRVGEMADYVYTTTGNGTSFENSRAFGVAIAKALKLDNVQGVILTST